MISCRLLISFIFLSIPCTSCTSPFCSSHLPNTKPLLHRRSPCTLTRNPPLLPLHRNRTLQIPTLPKRRRSRHNTLHPTLRHTASPNLLITLNRPAPKESLILQSMCLSVFASLSHILYFMSPVFCGLLRRPFGVEMVDPDVLADESEGMGEEEIVWGQLVEVGC